MASWRSYSASRLIRKMKFTNMTGEIAERHGKYPTGSSEIAASTFMER
jgi:hypothetical protein